MKVLLFLFFPLLLFAQTTMEQSLDQAFLNAKKGISWSLTNIPYSKNNISKDIIEEERIIASVKLSKEIGGVKVISTGYFGAFEVETKIYKSYESLLKEQYIKEIPDVKL